MTEHKATPEQWAAGRYDWSLADTEALHGDSAFRCILELRDRVEALEAAAKPVESNAPASSDSLMEEVVDAITDASAAYGSADAQEARAAIHAVADWFEQQGSHTTAARLRMEVR